MLNLQDEKSLILGLGDLKLSDTEYTFKVAKLVNGIYYKPIFPSLTWGDESSYLYDFLLSQLVSGDGRAGVEILKGDETLIYGFGANRLSSNASNIVLGLLAKEYSYFIKEYFDSCTIYDSNPELIQRDIIRVSDWERESAKYESFPVLSVYAKKLQIEKDTFECWKILEPIIAEFQDVFKEEQLNQLRVRRK